MIFTKLNSWDYNDNLEGLLFFAQRILELSFDKSEFYEKKLTPSVIEIISECLRLIKYTEEKNVDNNSKEFECLFDELIFKIKEDEISSNLLGINRDKYLNKLNSSTDINALKNILQILKLKLNPREYFREAKKLIPDAIVDYKKKDRIYDLTTRLFEFLTGYGYQKGTIYYAVNKFFFSKNRQDKVKDLGCIDNFFDFFDLKFKSFEVVFLGSKLFNEIKESCEKFGLKVSSDLTTRYDEKEEGHFYENHKGKKTYLSLQDVKAVDYLHAMKLASSKISFISNLFVVFYHKEKPWVSDYSLVYNHSKSNVANINRPTNVMLASGDKISEAKEIFRTFLEHFYLKGDSMNRFRRGVGLHSLSLETKESSSQILNLWICLETFLIHDNNKTHIASVTDVMQEVSYNYHIYEEIQSLHDLISRWNDIAFKKIIEQLPDSFKENEVLAVSALVSIKNFEGVASQLLAEMGDQPLLRYKFMRLARTLQSRKRVSKKLEINQKRCLWDIRRIYRIRNSIVHSGYINQDNDHVVETAHYYLDLLLSVLIFRKVLFRDIDSIENLIQQMKLLREIRTEALSSKPVITNGIEIDESNFLEIVVGADIHSMS
ncbi:TPA: hypothetical protein ACJ2XZ_001826 [Yersinia enterocolitica]